jgi:hypothetical protein
VILCLVILLLRYIGFFNFFDKSGDVFMIRMLGTIAIISSVVTSVFAGPKIHFDTTTFDCGTAIEGVTEKIHATFVVKNPGDSTLKLTTVKPGCGCTVVKFDSLIEPGKSTRIEAEVNIKGYHSGPISKYVNVFSNAEKEASRLVINAIIQAAIDASENYLRFDPANLSPKAITLSSKKTDLKVSNISFFSDNTDTDAAKKNQKLPVTFKFTPTDSTRADGYKIYKLEINPPKYDSNLYGQFIITTNHPDRKELTIRGNLNK